MFFFGGCALGFGVVVASLGGFGCHDERRWAIIGGIAGAVFGGSIEVGGGGMGVRRYHIVVGAAVGEETG